MCRSYKVYTQNVECHHACNLRVGGTIILHQVVCAFSSLQNYIYETLFKLQHLQCLTWNNIRKLTITMTFTLLAKPSSYGASIRTLLTTLSFFRWSCTAWHVRIVIATFNFIFYLNWASQKVGLGRGNLLNMIWYKIQIKMLIDQIYIS